MPWRRCCISTTRGRTASGFRISTADARTSRRCDFLQRLNTVTHGRAAGHDHRRRGVHLVAGGQPPDLRRRTRVHVQVEHGLDARHARVRPARTRCIAAGITTRSRSRCCIRSPRTSCCRSRTTRSSTASASMLDKMPGDVWQKHATLRALYGYMFGASGQEADVHGMRVRAVARVGPRFEPRLASARRAAARGAAALGARPEPHVSARARRCTRSTSRARDSAGSTARTTRTASSR